ncbi:MAG TPA: hypothetical protein VGB85_09675 [Nannocystis sp.]|jgi:hypothetical protein
MRTLILALIPGLLLACNNDITASAGTDDSTAGDSTGTSDPSSPSDPSNPTDPTSPGTDPTTGASDPTNPTGQTTTTAGTATSEPGTTSPPPTTEPGTATSEATTAGTTDDTTAGDTDTDTGSGVCGGEGTVIDATLVHVGQDPGCGALEFTGSNYDLAPGPIYALDGCPCGANCLKPDPWTFTLDVPQEWLPKAVPACPRIVVERQMSKAGCELVGVAIWDMQEPEGAPAIYHAGSLLGPIAAAADQITIESVVAEECECADCCSVPTRWDLGFGGLKSAVTIAEGQTGMLGDQDLGFEIINFQSHISGICDDSPAIDWVARRVGGL